MTATLTSSTVDASVRTDLSHRLTAPAVTYTQTLNYVTQSMKHDDIESDIYSRQTEPMVSETVGS